MTLTVNDLKRGDKCLIKDVATEQLPIKLLELGCLPGNSIELVARYIEVELSNSDSNE